MLVSPAQPKAIADAILDFYQTPEAEISQMTENARQLAKNRLIWEDQIHQYVQLYQNAMQ